jgi:hypothetical protein
MRARRNDGLGVVVPEGGDGAIVRRELLHEPQRFKVADAGPLEVPGRANLVEIAPDIQPKHVPGMVAGPAGRRRDGASKAEFCEVETTNERVDNSHQGFGSDIVIDAGRQQAYLCPICSFQEAHENPHGSFVAH